MVKTDTFTWHQHLLDTLHLVAFNWNVSTVHVFWCEINAWRWLYIFGYYVVHTGRHLASVIMFWLKSWMSDESVNNIIHSLSLMQQVDNGVWHVRVPVAEFFYWGLQVCFQTLRFAWLAASVCYVMPDHRFVSNSIVTLVNERTVAIIRFSLGDGEFSCQCM